MSQKSKGGLHKPNSNGGSYLLLPHSVIDALLPYARRRELAVLIAIARRFNGFNNGKISVSMREIAEATGSTDYSANGKAISWLVEAGFVWIAATYPKGARMAREYGLTWVSSGSEQKPVPARNTYVEMEKIRRLETGTRHPLSVPVSGTERKLSVPVSGTGATETSQSCTPSPVPVSGTHIVSHRKGEGRGRKDAPQSPPKLQRADLSSVMTADDLRSLTADYLAWAPAGAQSQLAHAAEMPCGTLSKFVNGKASLPAQYLMPLQLAVGRSFPLNARP